MTRTKNEMSNEKKLKQRNLGRVSKEGLAVEAFLEAFVCLCQPCSSQLILLSFMPNALFSVDTT